MDKLSNRKRGRMIWSFLLTLGLLVSMLSTVDIVAASSNTDRTKDYPSISTSANEPSATVGNCTITGTKDKALSTTQLNITLKNDTAKAIDDSTDATDWFKNMPSGRMGANVKAVASGATTITLRLWGTPSEFKSEPIQITIPGEYLASGKDLAVTTNPAAKWAIIKASATVGNCTVTGIKGKALTDTYLNITLKGDVVGRKIVKSTSTTAWFKTIPAGLSAVLAEEANEGSTAMKFHIYGTPTETKSGPIQITIPGTYLKSETALAVTTNPEAKWNIKDFVEYNVIVQNDGHGTGTATPKKAGKGAEVTLTAAPNDGYQFKEWEVVKGDITITNNTFTMPESDVTVKAIFKKGITNTTDKSDKTDKTGKSDKPDVNSPKTDDPTNMALLVSLLALSGMAMLLSILGIFRKRLLNKR